MYTYRIMEEADGNFTIMYRQNGFVRFFGSDFYYLRHSSKIDPDSTIMTFKTLAEAVEHVNEEIRRDKYPIVVKEIE